jgi:hypothetical protein
MLSETAMWQAIDAELKAGDMHAAARYAFANAAISVSRNTA